MRRSPPPEEFEGLIANLELYFWNRNAARVMRAVLEEYFARGENPWMTRYQVRKLLGPKAISPSVFYRTVLPKLQQVRFLETSSESPPRVRVNERFVRELLGALARFHQSPEQPEDVARETLQTILKNLSRPEPRS